MTGRTQSVADRQSEQSVIGQSGNWEELLLDSALTSGCDGECGGMHPCELSRAALLRASPVLLLPLLTRIHEDQHRSVVCTYAAVVFDSGADAARRAAALVPGYGPLTTFAVCSRDILSDYRPIGDCPLPIDCQSGNRQSSNRAPQASSSLCPDCRMFDRSVLN